MCCGRGGGCSGGAALWARRGLACLPSALASWLNHSRQHELGSHWEPAGSPTLLLRFLTAACCRAALPTNPP